MPHSAPDSRSAAACRWPRSLGLIGAIGLAVGAIALPQLTGWDTHASAGRARTLPPWFGYLWPHVGVTTPIAVLLGALGVWFGPRLAASLSWRRLLVLAWITSLAWLLCLALVDGPQGISQVLGSSAEYLPTARSVNDVGALLRTYVDHIPLDSDHRFPVHVAGHPPAMLLFFVGLVRVGLGSDFRAGLAVVVVASTIAPAVLLTLRRLDAEVAARLVAPYLVLTPAAVFLAVSADAVMAAVAAWSMVLLAIAATTRGRPQVAAGLGAGLGFGLLVMMSYGLPTFGLIAIGLLVAARQFLRPVLLTAVGALAVVGGFALAGFAWWQALPVLSDRYWDGIASQRPAAYWLWANLAVLVLTAGPFLVPGIVTLGRADPAVRPMVIGAVLAVFVASVSLMSKAETERIWLPFMPWLTLAVVALPERWRRIGLAVHVTLALALQHLLFTVW